MSSQPWMKFYPADWRSEITLKMVSREARSLWFDILCLIHEGGDGRLHFDGLNPSDKMLATVLGDNPRTIKKLMGELENGKVFSRDEHGFIISRRIIRDIEKAERDRLNGRKGGSPLLKNNELAKTGVNPEDKAQKLEARSYIKEEDKSSSKKKGTRLPEDFVCNLDFAVSEGLNSSQAMVEANKFRDYWISQPGQRGVKLDWPATWRNWVRNSSSRSVPTSQAPPRRETMADFTGALLRQMTEPQEQRHEPDHTNRPAIEGRNTVGDYPAFGSALQRITST